MGEPGAEVAADLCRILAAQDEGATGGRRPLLFPRVVTSFLCGGRFLASPAAERLVNRLRTKAQDSSRLNVNAFLELLIPVGFPVVPPFLHPALSTGILATKYQLHGITFCSPVY